MYILFDIGGTKTRVARATNLDAFEEPRVYPTPLNYNEGIGELKKVTQELSSGQKIEAIVGGIAGPFGERSGSLLTSPNLSDWALKPLVRDLEEAFDTKVFIENDSAMASLGEASFGAGRNNSIVAYLTVSTGVGGARVVDGRLDKHAIGFEPGHQIIDPSKTLIEGAQDIYLGTIISGKAVKNREGLDPEKIVDPVFWDKMAQVLAYGVHNVIVFWSPNVVVLGGSMMNEVGISVSKVKEHLEKVMKIFPELPKIVKSELGDLSGLWGCLAYLRGINIE